mmetsp:Transcript_16487/g.25749  ORF Transcript_16487/g.25749 Transcript_16487/m.25749 type:complete len:94 (+) Transcript_16487:1325-1606(+)
MKGSVMKRTAPVSKMHFSARNIVSGVPKVEISTEDAPVSPSVQLIAAVVTLPNVSATLTYANTVVHVVTNQTNQLQNSDAETTTYLCVVISDF